MNDFNSDSDGPPQSDSIADQDLNDENAGADLGWAKAIMGGTGTKPNAPSSDEPESSDVLETVTELPAFADTFLARLVEYRVAGKLSNSGLDANLDKLKTALKKRCSITVSVESLRKDFNDRRTSAQAEEEAIGKLQIEADGSSLLPELSEAQLAAARELGTGNILKKFQSALKLLGYVADDYTTLGIMHTVYARLLPKKTGWLHKGPKRSGKSLGLDGGFQLLHPSNCMRATSMTVGAVYSLGRLEHIFILCGELRVSGKAEDDDLQRVLRQFISEPEMTHVRLEEVNTAGGKKYVRTEHTVSGVASIAWTTTKDSELLNDEFTARLTAIESNSSIEVTKRVMELKAARAKSPLQHKEAEREMIELFQLFDLSLRPLEVAIDYSDKICISPTDPSARSNYDLLLQHIKISALYNQHQRERDSDGCIVATFYDYEAAYELMERGAYRALDPLSGPARSALQQFRQTWNLDDQFTVYDLMKKFGKARTTVQDWLKQWTVADLVDEIGSFDRKTCYRLNDREIAEHDLGWVTPASLSAILRNTETSTPPNY